MLTDRYFRFYGLLYILVLLVGLNGCDEHIYASGEVEAKRRYEAINVGTPRESVLQTLGTPMFDLSWNPKLKMYEYLDTKSKRIFIVDASNASGSTTPPELYFLPKELNSPAVLVYSAGTVFGYIGLDTSNRVSKVKVIVS